MTVQTESISFFDVRTAERRVSLLPSQYDPSTPSIQGLERSTNLLIPDYITQRRLDHFPEDLYDLRPHSHLVRFMRALMGDAGAGAARKRYLIARFQQAFTSTHFFDLDRFYGAIFGTNRLQDERLTINPYVQSATGEEWDRVHTSDAKFRERVFALAKAIPMGGTRPGLKTAAEAIVGAPCEVSEEWSKIDWLHGHGFFTDDDVSTAPEPTLVRHRDWRNFFEDLVLTWDRAQQQVRYGSPKEYPDLPVIPSMQWRKIHLGRVLNDRAVVTVRPLKAYPDSDLGRSQKAQDEQSLRRVLGVLKPANVKLKIDMNAQGLYSQRDVRGFSSDSDYFEIVQTVTPATGRQASAYPISPFQRRAGVTETMAREVPRPAFSAVQTAEWNYANEVVAVRSYAEVTGSSGAHLVVDGANFDRVADIYGQVTEYSGEKGILDPRQAEAGRLSGDASLVSGPYADDRKVVLPHG